MTKRAVMHPNEHDIPERRAPRRSGRFALFYFEQIGSRYYLRFTRLAVFLVVVLTVVPMAAIFSLFLRQRNRDSENINVNITAPTPGGLEYPAIRPLPPPPTPPKVIQQPVPGMQTRQTPSVPAGNDNKMSTPSPTTSPTPARTPP